jgi:hypothetical protein
MPNTPDHKVAMHQLVRERRSQGKPVWEHKIRLGDVWQDEELDFEQRRNKIVARIRASAWFKGYGEFDDLPQIVEELSGIEDADGFDEVWDSLYDIADYDRVWIDRSTLPRPPAS